MYMIYHYCMFTRIQRLQFVPFPLRYTHLLFSQHISLLPEQLTLLANYVKSGP